MGFSVSVSVSVVLTLSSRFGCDPFPSPFCVPTHCALGAADLDVGLGARGLLCARFCCLCPWRETETQTDAALKSLGPGEPSLHMCFQPRRAAPQQRELWWAGGLGQLGVPALPLHCGI